MNKDEVKAKLTEAEKEVLELTAQCYNKFVALEMTSSHPNADQEFAQAIHLLQGLIARRVAKRANPEIWN